MKARPRSTTQRLVLSSHAPPIFPTCSLPTGRQVCVRESARELGYDPLKERQLEAAVAAFKLQRTVRSISSRGILPDNKTIASLAFVQLTPHSFFLLLWSK